MENDKTICPFCKSYKVRKFAYGLIQFESKEAEKKFMKKYVLGGCFVSDENPMFHCDNCQKDFGFREKKLPSNYKEPLNMKSKSKNK